MGGKICPKMEFIPFLQFSKFHRKAPVLESFFHNVAGLRTPILENICKRLLLNLQPTDNYTVL